MDTELSGDVLHGPPTVAAPDPWEWTETGDVRESWLSAAAGQLDQHGILRITGAIPEKRATELARLVEREVELATPIERTMHARRRDSSGYKVYNLQARHPYFLELISCPFVVTLVRRYLGPDMTLHSSEGGVIPPGGCRSYALHMDVRDRIPDFYLAMTTIFYLQDCDRGSGATEYIPGTHREFITAADAARRETCAIRVESGDAVVFSPYIWHRGGHNQSSHARPAIINNYCRSFMKQEFDYPRQFGLREIRELTEEQLVLLGFRSQVPRDLKELYLMTHAQVPDFDPLGHEFNHRYGFNADGSIADLANVAMSPAPGEPFDG